jgi:hypothetical protein
MMIMTTAPGDGGPVASKACPQTRVVFSVTRWMRGATVPNQGRTIRSGRMPGVYSPLFVAGDFVATDNH